MVASSPMHRWRKPPIFAFAYISPARSSKRRISSIRSRMATQVSFSGSSRRPPSSSSLRRSVSLTAMVLDDTPSRAPRIFRAVSNGMAATATPASARAANERRMGPDVDPRSGQPLGRAPWIFGAAALVLYIATLAHGLAWDDNAELAAGVPPLGVVHPTVSPPYMLLGHIFTLIEPFGPPATSANAWSAICAAGAVVVAARYVLVRGGSVLGAGVAALILTVAPVLWYQATVASAYPFFMLTIALLITAGDAWMRSPTRGRLAW